MPNIGVLVDFKHGVSVKLSGSVNYFAMYSVSSSRIWVFGVKMDGDGGDEDGVVVKLFRCAVIECCRPVWCISVSFGFLILGEENGVRVFSLRRLVKGRDKKGKNLRLGGRGSSFLPNGVIGKGHCNEGHSEVICNGDVEGKVGKHRAPGECLCNY